MTTLLEFLAGNVLALGAVGVVAVLAAAIFLFGGDGHAAPRPTRPIATAADLGESAEVVAVVGTVECADPLRTPFLGDPAVAYEVGVGSPLGYVATLRNAVAFTLVVDGERVRVPSGDSPNESVTPTVDDGEHERVVVREDETEFDGDTREALAAFDATRSRPSRYLSGSVLPTRSERTYRVTPARVGDELAVVGRLRRRGDGWVLEPDDGGLLGFLDPAAVHRDP